MCWPLGLPSPGGNPTHKPVCSPPAGSECTHISTHHQLDCDCDTGSEPAASQLHSARSILMLQCISAPKNQTTTCRRAPAAYRLGSRRASQDAVSCLIITTIAVMLSQPTPRAALGSAARQASSSAQAASVGLMLASSFLLIKSTASWLVMTSHTPSQASRKKLSSGCVNRQQQQQGRRQAWHDGCYDTTPGSKPECMAAHTSGCELVLMCRSAAHAHIVHAKACRCSQLAGAESGRAHAIAACFPGLPTPAAA